MYFPDPMYLLTSISPVYSDVQDLCLSSWRKLTEHTVSFNKKEEIAGLQTRYPWIVFIPVENTGEAKFGRAVVSIDEFYKFALWLNKDVVIINSDIMLTEGIESAKDGIGAGRRYDYVDEAEEAVMTVQGFDYFYVPYRYVDILKDMGMYYMGICWWDYIVPLRAIRSGIPLYHLKKKIAFHKSHPINYNSKDRRYMEQVVMSTEEELSGFRTQFNDRQTPGLNIYAYSKILKHLR